MILQDSTIKKLDAFALAMKEHARGGMGGLRRARTTGSSVEFSDFRNYVAGDDLRRLDWNAYARFDKLFLKLFLDEQETTLRVLLDASASMQYGEPDKWPMALQLAAVLSYLSLSRYDRVVIAVLQGGGVRLSRAFGGRAAYAEVEAFLEGIKPQGQTQLNEAMLRVPVTAGRGVCALISDLLTEEGWTRGAGSLLYRKQEVSVLQVMASQELEPDFAGAIQLLDSEGGASCDVQMSPDTLRRYEEALAAFLKEQQQYCFARGMAYMLVRSDMQLERDVLKSLTAAGILSARV